MPVTFTPAITSVDTFETVCGGKCRKTSKFVRVEHGDMMDYSFRCLITCLTCGDRWAEGEMLPRPFAPKWREENIRKAKETLEWWNTYGTRMRELRKRHKKTQGEVARALGIKVSKVSAVELSTAPPYSPEQEKKLADLFGVLLDDVTRWEA